MPDDRPRSDPPFDEVTVSLAALEQELARFKRAVDHIDESKAAAGAATAVAEQLCSSMSQILPRLSALLEKIDRVDFPLRLDKLDTSVSAVTNAVQATQLRLEALERHLLEQVKHQDDNNAKRLAELAKSTTVWASLQIILLAGIGALLWLWRSP